jgi:hypothetical protein
MAQHHKREKGRVQVGLTVLVVARVLWAVLSASILFAYCVFGYYLFFLSLEKPYLAGITLTLLMLGPVLCGLTLSRNIRYSAWRLISISIIIFVSVPVTWQMALSVW